MCIVNCVKSFCTASRSAAFLWESFNICCFWHPKVEQRNDIEWKKSKTLLYCSRQCHCLCYRHYVTPVMYRVAQKNAHFLGYHIFAATKDIIMRFSLKCSEITAENNKSQVFFKRVLNILCRITGNGLRHSWRNLRWYLRSYQHFLLKYKLILLADRAILKHICVKLDCSKWFVGIYS